MTEQVTSTNAPCYSVERSLRYWTSFVLCIAMSYWIYNDIANDTAHLIYGKANTGFAQCAFHAKSSHPTREEAIYHGWIGEINYSVT